MDSSLRLIVKEVKRFQMLCHVIWGTDILFEKLLPKIGGWIWKTPFAYNASGDGELMQSLYSF